MQTTRQELLRKAVTLIGREELAVKLGVPAHLLDAWINGKASMPDRKLVGDMVDFISEKMPKLKRFGFLFVNDDFGKGGFDAFTEAGKQHGMSVVAEERYSRGDLDFTGQLTRIRAANPDAIVEWSRYTEGALIHRQIRQMGWEVPRFGSDGIAAPAFLGDP